jgi:hypothetical protein
VSCSAVRRLELDLGDGRPGDDDRIRRNVETVLGSAFDDALAGDAPPTCRPG